MRYLKAKGHYVRLLTTKSVFIETGYVVWIAVDRTFNGTRDCLVFLAFFFLTFHEMPMFGLLPSQLSSGFLPYLFSPDLAISALF